jgi:hypothetical protein
MKAILIILFTLFSLISTDTSNFHQIELNKEYKVDVKKYKEGYIPSGTINYFLVPVEENTSIEFQIKILHGKPFIFKVIASVYAEEPTEEEIIKRTKQEVSLVYKDKNQEGILDTYNYPFETGNNVKYVSFLVFNGDNVDYLSVQADEYRVIEWKIFDIYYKKELELKKANLEEVVIFRLENDNRNIRNITYIKFKTKKKLTSEILIKVAGYKSKPDNIFDIRSSEFAQDPTLKSVTNDEEYYIYEYEYECDYKKIDEIAYLCVFFSTNEKIDYLSVLIGNN